MASTETMVVEKEIEVDLTVEEINEAANMVAQLQDQVKFMTDDFNAILQKHLSATDDINLRIMDLIELVNKRKVKRLVKCVEVKDFKDGRVKLFYDGKLIETRQMKDKDRQMDIEQVIQPPPPETASDWDGLEL